MYEFTHRDKPVASAVAADRGPAPVRAAASVETSVPRAEVARRDVKPDAGPKPPAPDTIAQYGDQQARTFAAYAKVQTDIAATIADLDGPRRSPAMLEDAEKSILALMPRPSIVLPLPPASEEMVNFVAQVKQSILRQSAATRAAQGNVAPPVVDAATA